MYTQNVIRPKKIWPNRDSINPFEGFDDAYLEYICTDKVDSTIKDRPLRSPYLFWTTEVYGLGRCYRLWLKWPIILPIPVYGDHGVALSGEFEEYEINNRADYHLSWYSKRVESLKRYNKKKIIHITHPWVIYRKMAGYNLRENAKGTIVFYPHSTPTDEIIDYDWDSYFLELKSLDTNYKPIVICMHRHDVVKGYHKNIRKYEVPIVSAGEPSSPLFVDRFYDIVSNFRYATSPTGGSELFYCEEMGIRYFIFGKEPIYHNFSHPQNPLGVLRPKDEVAVIANEIKRNLFSNLPPKDDFRKQQFVSDVLGLDLDHLATAKVLRKIFIFETIRLLPIIFQIAITKLLIKVLIKAKRLVLNIRN